MILSAFTSITALSATKYSKLVMAYNTQKVFSGLSFALSYFPISLLNVKPSAVNSHLGHTVLLYQVFLSFYVNWANMTC